MIFICHEIKRCIIWKLIGIASFCSLHQFWNNSATPGARTYRPNFEFFNSSFFINYSTGKIYSISGQNWTVKFISALEWKVIANNTWRVINLHWPEGNDRNTRFLIFSYNCSNQTIFTICNIIWNISRTIFIFLMDN